MKKIASLLIALTIFLIATSYANEFKDRQDAYSALMKPLLGFKKKDVDFKKFKEYEIKALLPVFRPVPATTIYTHPTNKEKQVSVSGSFMTEAEITNLQYLFFLNSNDTLPLNIQPYIDISQESCRIKKSGDKYIVEEGYEDFPVVNVSYFGCEAYCHWLTEWFVNKQFENKEEASFPRFRLPLYLEWNAASLYEKSYSPEDSVNYSELAPLGDYAWYEQNSGNSIHKIKEKKSTYLEFYDLKGNAAEWVLDVDARQVITDGYQYNVSNESTDSASVCGGSFAENEEDLNYYANIILAKGTQTPSIGFRISVPFLLRSSSYEFD